MTDRDLTIPATIHEEEREPQEEKELREGIALCLSGGGYRAMLFHLGGLWRLNEAGYLPKLRRVSSVSGGSIVAAMLGLKWSRLAFDADGVAASFDAEIVDPIRKLARKTIDAGSILSGIFTPGSINDKVRRKYTELYGAATLQDLPADTEGPRFIINATNLQSGVLWRFSRPYMADYLVGRVNHPDVSLAEAVAASSAFPPVLSPATLEVDREAWDPGSKDWHLADLQKTGKVYLSDGGVYDNLGLEAAIKSYKTLLVSNGGGALAPEKKINRDWLRHSVRVLQVIDRQVRSLRKQALIGAFKKKTRDGAFWSIRGEVADYGLADPLPASPKKTARLAEIKTRLKKLSGKDQEELINWGYIMCDTALRKWVDPELDRPDALPYPKRKLD
jgi:NTE family protein